MNLPDPGREFIWTDESWGPALRCAPLLERAPHLFTTRELALRGAPAETDAAWRQVHAAVGLVDGRIVRLRQVHGTRVVSVARPLPADFADQQFEGDILISDEPAVGLAVRVADCVPVLLADARTGAVGAVHSGWRGTAAGAVLAAVAAIENAYGAHPRDLMAAVGPSIGPCCYEVGGELVERFAAHPESARWFIRGRGLRLDLWRATRDQLLRAGLRAGRVHVARLCSACHRDLFCSYRREGEPTGRMAGVILSGGALPHTPARALAGAPPPRAAPSRAGGARR